MEKYDVIIIGGSYAGLSAAMALGRFSQKTLIIDGGDPCNIQASEAHNFLAHEGNSPRAIAESARHQLRRYERVDWLDDHAIEIRKTEGGFITGTKNGLSAYAKKILLATGIEDILPDIPGFSACWGRSIIDCPYCHGFEYRNRTTAILASGKEAFRLFSLVKNLTSDIIIIPTGEDHLSNAQLKKINKAGGRIMNNEIDNIQHEHGQIQAINFRDGSRCSVDALYAMLPFRQKSDLYQQLGCSLTEHGYIKVNKLQKTSVRNVFACGDNSNYLRSISSAVYAGTKAGMTINKELCLQNF